ncbi:RelA/SpoT family protein [Thermoproteota archaeon]
MSNLKTYKNLTDKLSGYLSPESLKLIDKAYKFAKKAHEGQLRLSKDKYITHPINVAYILAELQQDPNSIAAALLHDTIEDCTVPRETLIKEFGEEITNLVDGVTKLGRITFESEEAEQAENFRKMFMAMGKDIRVIIIKLADRLHNMRTLEHLDKKRQQRIAHETREIFAPLAHRLGMWSMKWELEDLCFYFLQPEEFQHIKKLVTDKRIFRENYVETFRIKMEELIQSVDLKAKISGRPKHFFSIYKKLEKQQIPFDELYDTLGIRIIVDNVKECYQVLGVIHSAYIPINGRIKDYIAMPKSNMYQSLHTTVIGPEGKPVEIQIRTPQMHQIAEYGIAAHWQYKEGEKHKHDAEFAWLREMIEQQSETEAPKDFLQNLKLDLFVDEVFVFTPKGDVYILPHGATPLDFAYKIHTEVGHRFIGAKVNNHIVPIDHKLKSGDQLEILTSNKPNPKSDWLTIVATSHAKTKIRQWFRKQDSSENILKGKEKLEKALQALKLQPKETLTNDLLDELKRKHQVNKFEDVFLLITYGDISIREIIHAIERLKPQKEDDIPLELEQPKPSAKPGTPGNIKVLGENNVMVRMAKCCNALPGDPITGFITIGSGISVHRSDCNQILCLKEKDKARIIQVEWNLSNESGSQLYPASVEIEAFDRLGLLRDIISLITDAKTNIRDIKSRPSATEGIVLIMIIVDIKDRQELLHLKTILKNISDVISVRRTM